MAVSERRAEDDEGECSRDRGEPIPGADPGDADQLGRGGSEQDQEGQGCQLLQVRGTGLSEYAEMLIY